MVGRVLHQGKPQARLHPARNHGGDPAGGKVHRFFETVLHRGHLERDRGIIITILVYLLPAIATGTVLMVWYIRYSSVVILAPTID